MTMAEKKVESIKKEIEKLEKSLERYTGIYNKKAEKCEKLGCKWTDEEMRAHRDVDMTDVQWGAWFEMSVAEMNTKDTQERLEHSFNRLERAEAELDKVQAKIDEANEITAKELSWLNSMEKKEEEYYAWLSQFRAECLKDGITLDDISNWHITGTTHGGKHFSMYLNDGFTERSLHSYTLRVNGCVFFTSGLFSTGYRYLMNH